MNSIITVGITGGIGTGKSLVCRILNIMGYPVFYSDKEARTILNQDKEAIASVTSLFGTQTYNESGLNHAYISEQVFKKTELLESLNNIVHPLVRKAFDNWKIAQKSTIVFNEAAILFETGAYKKNNFNILVTSPLQLRMNRIKLRDNLTDEQIKQRMAKQWDDEKKVPLADFVIFNDEQNLVIPQVQNILNKLKK